MLCRWQTAVLRSWTLKAYKQWRVWLDPIATRTSCLRWASHFALQSSLQLVSSIDGLTAATLFRTGLRSPALKIWSKVSERTS